MGAEAMGIGFLEMVLILRRTFVFVVHQRIILWENIYTG